MTSSFIDKRKSGFTPGPWITSADDPCEIVSARGDAVAVTDLGVDRQGVEIANARLIAAAPAMFGILKDIREHGHALVRIGKDADLQAWIDRTLSKAESNP